MQCLLPYHEGTEAYNWMSWKTIKEKLIQQLFAISSKIFTAKLQFLHNKVAYIHFFPSCQFQTLQCMLGRSKRSYSPKQKNSISPFGNALQGQKMTTMIECSVFYHIMKELKLTIEYLGRYKTKTYSTTFCNIFKYFHC